MTLFLNEREIVTMMTIGDYRKELAVGYLLNQNMLVSAAEVTDVEVDDDLDLAVVRTTTRTDFEEKLKKKTLTSGCAQGTVFGDMMEKFEQIELSSDTRMTVSALQAILKETNTTPSLYLKTGAIHGCALCDTDGALLAYMEDVGRHNAVDKIAGHMALSGLTGADKVFYTTGRLTSEMVLKTVAMGIPILLSRSGFTAWGVELAQQVGLTLIGRAKGARFTLLSGRERLIYDL